MMAIMNKEGARNPVHYNEGSFLSVINQNSHKSVSSLESLGLIFIKTHFFLLLEGHIKIVFFAHIHLFCYFQMPFFDLKFCTCHEPM